jgi:hypothetical protein
MTEYLDDPFVGLTINHELSKRIDEVPCPISPLGLSQVARRCLGYCEREPLRLQLRVALLYTEEVCDVAVDERASHVVRVVICWHDDLPDGYLEPGFAEERTHTYLQEPLAARPLLDFETGEPVPFYVPTWLDGHRTKAPGYYTDRREATAGAELLPRREDDSPLRVRGALARSRAPRW